MSKPKKKKDRKRKVSTAHNKRAQVNEVKLSELKAIIERAKSGALSEGDVNQLESAVDTLAFLTMELEKKGVSIQRLRQLIFGSSSEKTRDVFSDDNKDKPENDLANGDNNNRDEHKASSAQQKPKRKHAQIFMDLRLSEEERLIKNTAAQFVDRELISREGDYLKQREAFLQIGRAHV